MKKISVPLFSCGSECGDWLNHNCESCIKAVREKNNFEYTKGRCSIQRDIHIQMFGGGNEPVSSKSVEAVKNWDCPHKQEHYPQRKKSQRKVKGQLDLSFE